MATTYYDPVTGQPSSRPPGYVPPDNPTTNPEGYAGPQAALDTAAWQYATQHSKDPVQQVNLALEYKQKNDPSFQLPDGYKEDDNGHITVDTGGGLLDPNNIALMAVGVVFGFGVAAAFAGGGGAAASSVAGTAEAGSTAPEAAATYGLADIGLESTGVPALETVGTASAAGGSTVAGGTIAPELATTLTSGNATSSGLVDLGNGMYQDPATGLITDASGQTTAAGTVAGGNATGLETGTTLGANGLPLTTAQKIAGLLNQGGAAVSGALKSAGDTQLENAKLALQAEEANQRGGLTANEQNIQGVNAMENQLLQRSIQEQSQRNQASKDAYKASYANTPHTGPFGAAAAPSGYSPTYLNTINALGSQAQQSLSQPGQYSIDRLPAVPTYQAYTPQNVPIPSAIPAGQPGSTQPSTGQKIAQYVPTALQIGSAIAGMI